MAAAYSAHSFALSRSFADPEQPPPLPRLSHHSHASHALHASHVSHASHALQVSHASADSAQFTSVAHSGTSVATVEAAAFTGAVSGLNLAASLLDRSLLTPSASTSAAALTEPHLNQSPSFSPRPPRSSGHSGGAVAPQMHPIRLSARGRSGGVSGNEALSPAVSPRPGAGATSMATSPRLGLGTAAPAASGGAGMLGAHESLQAPPLGSARRLGNCAGQDAQGTGKSSPPSTLTPSPTSGWVGCCGSGAGTKFAATTPSGGGNSAATTPAVGGGPPLLSSGRWSGAECARPVAAATEGASRWRVSPGSPEEGAFSPSPSSVALGAVPGGPVPTTNWGEAVRAHGKPSVGSSPGGDQAYNANFVDGSPAAGTSGVQETFPSMPQQPFQYDHCGTRPTGSLPPAGCCGDGFNGGVASDSLVALANASASMVPWPPATTWKQDVSSALALPGGYQMPWQPPPLPPMSAELRLVLQSLEARQETSVRADIALEQHVEHLSAQLAMAESTARHNTTLEVELERCRRDCDQRVAAAEAGEARAQARTAEAVDESKRRHRDLIEQHLLDLGRAQEALDVQAEEHTRMLREAQLGHHNAMPVTQNSRSLDVETRDSATAMLRAEQAEAALLEERRLHHEERRLREHGERRQKGLEDDIKDSHIKSSSRIVELEREIETYKFKGGQMEEYVKTYEQTIREHQVELAALRGQFQKAMGESAQKATELELVRDELEKSQRTKHEFLSQERSLRESLANEQGQIKILNMELERLKAECDSMRARLKMQKDGETMRRHSLTAETHLSVQRLASQRMSMVPAKEVVEVDIADD
eukprot:TRINITY_DN75548_c0_g1_i1.p1 TRINITY_DN75548_c0_g1~~TRINITY_DN75548_c0_g1_i1.p1  ORF type:complete len:821 (+),score=151.01 TRINITY_DN75548_c0_g1_i1:88-2550(+)